MGIVFQVSNILLKSNALFSCTGGSVLWLPPSAFTPKLDRKYDSSRSGAASLATTIAEPKARPGHISLLGYLKDSFYCLCNRNCLSCEGSSLPSWKSMVTCCSGYGRKWFIGLTSALIQRADTYSTYVLYKKKNPDSFSVHLKVLYYKHFRHLSVQIFWIMNNPVSPPYVFCLVKYCIDRIL